MIQNHEICFISRKYWQNVYTYVHFQQLKPYPTKWNGCPWQGIVLETESQLIFMLLYARLSYVRYHFIQQGISIVRVYHRKWNVFNILRSNYTLSRITQIRFCNPMHWNAQRHCTLCPLYEIRLDKTALCLQLAKTTNRIFFWFLQVWILFTQWFLTKTKGLCWSKAYLLFRL